MLSGGIMRISLKQEKNEIPAGVFVEVVGYHFKITYACDVFAYEVRDPVPKFYVPKEKLNSKPEYTWPNIDRFILRNPKLECVGVLPEEVLKVERIPIKLKK